MKKHHSNRSMFSGKLGFVLSAAGASVGLGNIWRFPYLAAKYGGGIFLLIYILLALTFGYTMIVAETSLGRMTRKSPVGAFASFTKSHTLKAGGWINAIIPILIVPYYSVIGGFTADTVTGTCVYCNHCQPCPAGIDIGLANKYYDLALAGDAIAANHYTKLTVKASACLQCGHCESRCPFSVKQMERMEKISAYFGE